MKIILIFSLRKRQRASLSMNFSHKIVTFDMLRCSEKNTSHSFITNCITRITQINIAIGNQAVIKNSSMTRNDAHDIMIYHL